MRFACCGSLTIQLKLRSCDPAFSKAMSQAIYGEAPKGIKKLMWVPDARTSYKRLAIVRHSHFSKATAMADGNPSENCFKLPKASTGKPPNELRRQSEVSPTW